jgi:hypothetical protein
MKNKKRLKTIIELVALVMLLIVNFFVFNGFFITYEKMDAKTEHFIKCIAGGEDLTFNEKLVLFREKLELYCRMDKRDSPANLNDMGPKDLVKYIINEVLKGNADEFFKNASPEAFIERDINISAFKQFDSDVFDAIMKLEGECGNPRIEITYDTFASREGIPTPLYNPIYHKIQLAPILNVEYKHEIFEDFISELSHAKQHRENPVLFLFKGLRDNVMVFCTMCLYFKNYQTAYDETLYDMKGTLEYDAHNIVELELRKEYEKLVNGEYVMPITLVTHP